MWLLPNTGIERVAAATLSVKTLLKDELLVIAELIERHRDEFQSELSEIRQRREWNKKKAALQQKPKQAPSVGGL